MDGMGQSVALVHNFLKDLAWSEKAGDEPFWNAIYHKAFPNMVSAMSCPGDFASQRMGIDRVILLSNGETIKIDEKKRREDRGDILLEYISNDVTDAPGWIEKDLAIQYLAYAFIPSRRCYLFDWPMLRRAWLKFKDGWISRGPFIAAQNNGYKTISTAVPTKELLSAVSSARIIQL